jgi:hypothetical protein
MLSTFQNFAIRLMSDTLIESSRRDDYDGYFTWGGALLQHELVEL